MPNHRSKPALPFAGEPKTRIRRQNGVEVHRDAERWTMRRRRRDATNRLYTHRFGPPPLSAMLIFWVSFLPVSQSVEIEIYGISPIVESTLSLQPLQFTARKTAPQETDPLSPNDVVYRLNAAATLRGNVLTSVGRILLLRLDEESRVAFEIIYEGFRTRYIPAYDYLSLIPIIEGKISRQQLHSVFRVVERISTPYISSYAMLCLESLSDGRVNMELTKPTDLLSGIENDTVISLAMDKHRPTEVPLTFSEATSTIMKALRKNQWQPDLELVAALMMNLPNFDATNPEVPEAMNYVAAFMKRNSKQNDPILEYLSSDQLSRADQLVKEVLERILVSDLASFLVRESAGLLLQNFYATKNDTEFHERNTGDLFDIVVQDYYPRSIVAIAKYFRENLNRLKQNFDLALYPTELQALSNVIIQLYENPALSVFAREGAAALRSFVVQKQREEDRLESLDEIGVDRALEYLDAFRSPCLPEKLRIAAETLRPYLNDSLPWNYAFGDTCLRGNPYELMVNALINMKNIEMPEKLAQVLDHFIYHARSSGVTGKRGILYDHGIIFEREDSDEVELDVYSLLARLPNVFQDKRFSPLLTFFAKPNLIDYLGHRFNMFVYTKPRSLLMALLKTASDKPAVRTDEKLYKALRVGIAILEEPTIVNIYSSEELQNILKILPAVDIDPRYIPIKLLFKKENLFSHISPTFSLTGLESPVQHISLILKTIILKPIDHRLEEAINFALTNLEGPQLPARSYTREDFVYLVNHLFRHNKNIEIAILKSPIYRPVSDWNITVSGTPENVLARTLSYPIKSLSKNPELSSIIERAGKILEEETPQEIELLNKTTLNNMLEYLPDTTDLRPVNLLLKKANLAMFLPNRTVSTLQNEQPREALIFLLKNLLSSPHVKRETLLTKRLQLALKTVENSTQPAARDVSSVYTEELLNPLASKYKPLWKKFREFNGNLTVGNNNVTLQQFLLRLRDNKTNLKLGEAASLALEEIHYGVKSGMIPAIKDTEIIGALSLLPNEPRIDHLKKLLTPSWILDVLPPDFQSTEYSSEEQILRIILLMTKQRPEITENHILMSAITAAENSLTNWKRDVKPLKKIVTVLKDTLYDPLLAILQPKNLNKLQLNFTFDYRQTSKQLLVGLLHNLMLHPRINTDSHIMHVLDAVRQDVLNFGLDSDLLWVLDDAGIPYIPNLAPVRLFLHTNMATSRLVTLVYSVDSDVERYNMLLDLLSNDKMVQANQDLRKSIRELKRIVPRFKNPLGISETDIIDIFDAIPSEIIANYSDVRNLFSDSDTFQNLVPYSEIFDSQQPLTMLLLKLAQLPKVTRDESLIAQISGLYVALGDVIHNPVISGCDIRPLLRELHHARQINVDYMLQVIDPKMLSIYLPENVKYDNVRDDSILLRNILEDILAQRVVDSGTEFRTHVSSVYRDLTMFLKPEDKVKNLPSDREVKEMLKFIPRTTEFEAIRYLIEKKESFDQIPRSFDWSKYPTPLKKLEKILDFMKRQFESDYYLHKSVLTLDRYLLQKYFFLGDNEVRVLQGALNELPIDRGLAPLRLFLTVENLVMYLPSNISITRFNSPNKALIRILHILRDNQELRKDKLLQNSIAAATRAVDRPSPTLESKELENGAIRKSASKLTKYDLRFILNLDVENEALKNYLNPDKLISVLPESFSFVTKPTFKTKVLHLLKYLVNKKLGLVEELKKLLRQVKGLNDLCDIKKEDLEPLITAIEDNMIGVDFQLVKKYLTVKKLAKILPGNFDIKNSTNTQEALLKLIRALSYGLDSTNVKRILAFEKLLKVMQKPSYSLIKYKENITPAELKSLIEEIPYGKCKNIRPLKQNLTDNLTLNMLPPNLNLTLFKTRKLKLLEILKNVREHPDAFEYTKLIKLAEKCVEKMPNVPKLSDRDISELLSSSDLNQRDQAALLDTCKAADLAEYLPIAFDFKKVKSYKKKFKAVIENCKKLNLANITIKIALKNAEIYLAKLPAADISRDELNQVFGEICYCNFTSIKPLLLFAATNNLLSLLPRKFNFNGRSTVKHKLTALITALRNVQQFQNERMYRALETADETAHRLRSKPIISEDDVKSLKKLPIMMAQQVRPFAKIFVLSNLIKVVPPSFDVSDYEPEQTRLTQLLKYSENMDMVKTQGTYAASLAFVRRTLLREAEKETLEYLNKMISNVDEHIPVMLWVKSQQEREFFNRIKIPHGFEYPKIEDRLRVVLKFVVRDQKNLRSTSLVESLESLISQLSVGEPTDYEILEAINEISETEKNEELKIYLRCKDVQKRAKGLTLTPEHTAKHILLDLLKIVKKLAVDEEIILAIDGILADVQRAVWGSEAEELFKQIPNSKLHMARLEAIRLYYMSRGPEEIFGANYRVALPKKIERLEKLVSVLLASPDLLEKVELKTGAEYLKEVLSNRTDFKSQRHQRTMRDVDMKSLFTVLPKTRSERTILGLLKFFADPKLIDAMCEAIDPSRYKSQGPLMQEIINFGLTLAKVKNDPEQLKALDYVKDKILMTGSGALPVKLNTLTRHSTINPDLIGVLKSVDIRSANISVIMHIAKFFNSKYSSLIHGRGFDNEAHTTRGAFLKALLEHLVANSDVQQEIKKNAKILLNFVRLDGPGAAPVDLNEDTMPANRIFYSPWVAGYPQMDTSFAPHFHGGFSPYILGGTDIYSHFGSYHQRSHWEEFATVYPGFLSQPPPISLKKLIEKDNELPEVFDKGRSALRKSVIRILDPNSAQKKSKIAKQKEEEENESKWSQDMLKKRDTVKNSIKQTLGFIKRLLPQSGDTEYQKRREHGSSSKRETEKSSMISSHYDALNEAGFDSESATFSPDKVLVDVKKRINEGLSNKAAAGKRVLITEEEAVKLRKKKRRPIKPLAVKPRELPKPDSIHEAIPHNISRFPSKVNLESRKLFVRNETGADLDLTKEHSGAFNSKYMSFAGLENSKRNNKTVKKDLSQSTNGVYRMLADAERETIAIDNGITDSPPVSQALTLSRPELSETIIQGNLTKIEAKSSSKNNELLRGNETLNSSREIANRQSTDDLTVEEFKAHEKQHEILGTTVSPEIIDQKRVVFDRDHTLSEDTTREKDSEVHLAVKEKRATEKSTKYTSSASDKIDVEKLFEMKKVPCSAANLSSHSITRRKAEVDTGQHMLSFDEDYLDVPIATKLGATPDSSEYGNFHEIYPSVEKMYGEGFRRKRSTDFDLLMLQLDTAKENVDYNTAHPYKTGIDKVIHTARTSRRPKRFALKAKRP